MYVFRPEEIEQALLVKKNRCGGSHQMTAKAMSPASHQNAADHLLGLPNTATAAGHTEAFGMPSRLNCHESKAVMNSGPDFHNQFI
jgi:hypothetical protein